MNIAIVGLSSNIGGVETFIINIYRQLKEDGHSFFFLTTEDVICFEEEIRNNNDTILKYESRKNNYTNFKKDLKRIFEDYKFDVFWLNCCSLSCIEELKQAYKVNVPIRIIHSHNSQNMGNWLTLLLHSLHKLVLKKYITHSFACSDTAAKWMFSKSVYKRTIVFHNAIDAQKFEVNPKINLQMRKKLNIKNDALVVGHVGRFHFQKNHSFLLQIFSEYKKLQSNSILILCGSGKLKREIIENIKKYNLEDSIVMLENQTQMENIYQIFDVFLFPSLFEGLPFALIEAQAAGIPCLISNSISKEICITNLISYKALSDSASEWAIELNRVSKTIKTNTTDLIKKAGYDTKTNKSYFYSILEKNDKEVE